MCASCYLLCCYRELEQIGRTLATIGDEVNRFYDPDFDEFDALVEHMPDYVRLQLRRRRNVKRIARL